MLSEQFWVGAALVAVLAVALTLLHTSLNARISSLDGRLLALEGVLRALADDMATVRANQVSFDQRLTRIEGKLVP